MTNGIKFVSDGDHDYAIIGNDKEMSSVLPLIFASSSSPRRLRPAVFASPSSPRRLCLTIFASPSSPSSPRRTHRLLLIAFKLIVFASLSSSSSSLLAPVFASSWNLAFLGPAALFCLMVDHPWGGTVALRLRAP
ncbi:hypothetical protein OUZ56_007237 [Daphnia magna]|uniref:Uncharacterized protein n=1 Tax=Daphnia magna TaxID=35525 RepID=A0ABQ9YXZ7_9CRUS|nr:hypothetical protein OUZ56_007237 [Daphnia magna]